MARIRITAIQFTIREDNRTDHYIDTELLCPVGLPDQPKIRINTWHGRVA